MHCYGRLVAVTGQNDPFRQIMSFLSSPPFRVTKGADMHKKILGLMFLILFTLPGAASAETAVFTVTVTIPNQIAMPLESTGAATKDEKTGTLTQVQELVRHNQPVTVRSIVIL
ncbi:MAG: hypothetical protein V2A70_05300 [Candidatus Omnitrophota bacterium]